MASESTLNVSKSDDLLGTSLELLVVHTLGTDIAPLSLPCVTHDKAVYDRFRQEISRVLPFKDLTWRNKSGSMRRAADFDVNFEHVARRKGISKYFPGSGVGMDDDDRSLLMTPEAIIFLLYPEDNAQRDYIKGMIKKTQDLLSGLKPEEPRPSLLVLCMVPKRGEVAQAAQNFVSKLTMKSNVFERVKTEFSPSLGTHNIHTLSLLQSNTTNSTGSVIDESLTEFAGVLKKHIVNGYEVRIKSLDAIFKAEIEQGGGVKHVIRIARIANIIASTHERFLQYNEAINVYRDAGKYMEDSVADGTMSLTKTASNGTPGLSAIDIVNSASSIAQSRTIDLDDSDDMSTSCHLLSLQLYYFVHIQLLRLLGLCGAYVDFLGTVQSFLSTSESLLVQEQNTAVAASWAFTASLHLIEVFEALAIQNGTVHLEDQTTLDLVRAHLENFAFEHLVQIGGLKGLAPPDETRAEHANHSINGALEGLGVIVSDPVCFFRILEKLAQSTDASFALAGRPRMGRRVRRKLNDVLMSCARYEQAAECYSTLANEYMSEGWLYLEYELRLLLVQCLRASENDGELFMSYVRLLTLGHSIPAHVIESIHRKHGGSEEQVLEKFLELSETITLETSEPIFIQSMVTFESPRFNISDHEEVGQTSVLEAYEGQNIQYRMKVENHTDVVLNLRSVDVELVALWFGPSAKRFMNSFVSIQNLNDGRDAADEEYAALALTPQTRNLNVEVGGVQLEPGTNFISGEFTCAQPGLYSLENIFMTIGSVVFLAPMSESTSQQINVVDADPVTDARVWTALGQALVADAEQTLLVELDIFTKVKSFTAELVNRLDESCQMVDGPIRFCIGDLEHETTVEDGVLIVDAIRVPGDGRKRIAKFPIPIIYDHSQRFDRKVHIGDGAEHPDATRLTLKFIYENDSGKTYTRHCECPVVGKEIIAVEKIQWLHDSDAWQLSIRTKFCNVENFAVCSVNTRVRDLSTARGELVLPSGGTVMHADGQYSISTNSYLCHDTFHVIFPYNGSIAPPLDRLQGVLTFAAELRPLVPTLSNLPSVLTDVTRVNVHTPLLLDPRDAAIAYSLTPHGDVTTMEPLQSYGCDVRIENLCENLTGASVIYTLLPSQQWTSTGKITGTFDVPRPGEYETVTIAISPRRIGMLSWPVMEFCLVGVHTTERSGEEVAEDDTEQDRIITAVRPSKRRGYVKVA
eukprot:Clim_evm105s149 gene=Clim_evmTU105s149